MNSFLLTGSHLVDTTFGASIVGLSAMKGITEIDEQSAILLVRAYKVAYAQEGPRIRSEAWQAIAHHLNRKKLAQFDCNPMEETNFQYQITCQDMESRGRPVNWTNIEREYIRLFPNTGLDDASSSTSDGTTGTSAANGTNSQAGDDAMMLLEDEEEELAPSMVVSMVKTEPKWSTEAQQSLLSLHQPLISNDSVISALMNGNNENEVDENSTEQSAPHYPSSLNQQLPSIPPALQFSAALASQQTAMPAQFPDLRSLLTQIETTQRKRNFLLTLRNLRQQIDQFIEFFEQDLALATMVAATTASANGPF
ncbi:hypothetical protein M3Y98_00207900 [Aphelenchoides besseyi]|nr:hypothetical protein M3Y98_00207900 [Aphelenchoides besseyi]